jgi:hypothetical protein
MKLTPNELEIIKKWNLYLTMLMDCEKTWNEFLVLRQTNNINGDNLPRQAGKFFGMATSKANFMVATGRLLDYARKYSSIEEMLVELPPMVEEKGVSNARRK